MPTQQQLAALNDRQRAEARPRLERIATAIRAKTARQTICAEEGICRSVLYRLIAKAERAGLL